MATLDPDLNFRIPGRLAINPSDLATAFPHGGTALGAFREFHIRQQHITAPITAEEYGGEEVDVISLGQNWTVGVILRQWDDDVLGTIFPNTATGSSSGQKVVEHPGSVRAGASLASRSVVLIFTPDDTDQHPALILHKALPRIDAVEEFRLGATQGEALDFPCIFQAIRDSSGNAVSWGLLEDLSL